MENYARFLNHLKLVQSSTDFDELDPLEERLLNLFASVWHQNGQLTVLEAMGVSAETSGTTAHRRLKSLQQKGLIELVQDETDNRIKYVSPTPKTLQRFAVIGQCIQKAIAERSSPNPQASQ